MRRSILAVVVLAALACGDPAPRDDSGVVESDSPTPENDVAEPPEPAPSTLSHLDELPPELEQLMEPWTGDLDGMVERRMIRFVTVHNPMLYHLNGPKQGGIVYEAAAEFEKTLNRELGRRRLKVNVVIVPCPRDQILHALMKGRGDIVAANLTITPERLEQVDFSTPVMSDVSEIVVSGSASPPLASLEDLAGRELHLRPSSSYWPSVQRLNETFRSAGKPPIRLSAVEPYLEDHDLLEMVNAGLLPFTIVDSHKARFWSRVFERIVVHPDLSVRTGGQIAWAFRKNSPQLREVVDKFVREHRKGTLFGNIVYKRYLEDTSWLRNVSEGQGRDRLIEMSPLFRKYSERYGFDWRLVAAQAYQESALDQSRRSRAGAVGVMQLLPSTAAYVGVSDIDQLENNIHAGVKYLRYLVDRYFEDESLGLRDQHLLALAAYNAGPTRIKRLRGETARKGLDPNVWFDNVEVVVARNVGSETVRYVSNIIKYYVAYGLLIDDSPTSTPASG